MPPPSLSPLVPPPAQPSFSLWLPTVGVELLCGLVELSEHVRSGHRLPSDVVRFECADALAWKLPSDLGLVYVDDTAWDAPTIEALAARLSAKLPKGAIVIHNTEHGYSTLPRFRKLDAVSVGTSWNPRHTVHVHMTN